MQPVLGGLRSAFEFVDLAYDELVTREKLLPVANGNSALPCTVGEVHAEHD